MDNKAFNLVFEDQIARCQKLLGLKAEEYSSDEDRLANFKKAAHLEDITIEQALAGMMAKHTVSIYDMIKSGVYYSRTQWQEKITDHINYLILLEAVIAETQEERYGAPLIPTEKDAV